MIRRYLKSPARAATRKGSILLFSLVLISVAALLIGVLLRGVNNNQWEVTRSEERLAAFYTAESGVQQVIDWFNRPATSPNPTYFQPRSDGTWIDPATNRSTITTTFTVASANRPTLRFINSGLQANAVQGGVSELVVSPPLVTDSNSVIARVRSVGTGRYNVTSTVEMVLIANRVPDISVPAAIMTRGSAGSNGQFNVAWGEIWARNDLFVATRNLSQKYPGDPFSPYYSSHTAASSTTDPDRRPDYWFAARSERFIVANESNPLYMNPTERGGWRSTPLAAPATFSANNPYWRPYNYANLSTQNRADRNVGPYTNFYQNQTLRWPNYDYETMKSFALRAGIPIYRTRADGSLITPDGSVVSFEQAFNRVTYSDPDDVPRQNLPPMYFIDTIDGNPPAADRSNLATINIQGNGPFFHGYFFGAANFNFGGAGNSPDFNNAERPSYRSPSGNINIPVSTTRINNIRVYGLLYSYGTVESGGQSGVYGALYAEDGYRGNGTWDVYYDYLLSSPIRNRVGSKVTARLWDTY